MSQHVHLAHRTPLRTGPMGAMADEIQHHADRVMQQASIGHIAFPDLATMPSITIIGVGVIDKDGKAHFIRMKP